MENFILYDEISRDETRTVYKGRKKGSVSFVAVHCISKDQRPETTNHVRLTNELKDVHVVEFYEWYETTNHLWLIVELCTGGSLELILQQDGCLPEDCVRFFGVDLVRGLHYIHSMGLVFCDIIPSKIQLDSMGALKYDDFGLCRVEGENLEEIFSLTPADVEAGENERSDEDRLSPRLKRTMGSPLYTAPEIFEGEKYSTSSDLWSLGCVLYHMIVGNPPFEADHLFEIRDLVLNTKHSLSGHKGLRSQPSSDFSDIIDRLLCKEPSERMTWSELVTHPFWKGQLDTDAEGKTSTASLRDVTGNRGGLETVSTSSMKLSMPDEGKPPSESSGFKSCIPSPRGARPQTSPDPRETSTAGEAHFTISARPRSSPAKNEGDFLTKPTTPSHRKKSSAMDDCPEANDEQDETARLVYGIWDLTTSPICDNPKIQKPASLKYDPKAIPMTVHSKEKLSKFKEKELTAFLSKLADHINKMKDKSASEQRTKCQLLTYAASICSTSNVATLVLSSKLMSSLQLCLKPTQSLEIRCRAARVIGLAAQNAQELTEDVKLTELITILTEVIRDNARNVRLKQAVLPALGELLFLVATHEEQMNRHVEVWTVPAITYTMIVRCIRDGEDAIVQHFASKAIENVASTNGMHCQKFSTNENGHLLWHLFMHSTADTLRVSAIMALCRVTKQSPTIFQGVIEKAGLPAVLEGLAVNVPRIQQAIVTMFAWVLTEGAHLQRLVQEKDFTLHVMRLVESPSLVIRAKAFLTVYKIITRNPDMIPLCCKSRLIMFIERDWRKGSEGCNDPAQGDYLLNCLELLTSHLVETVPGILGATVNALNDVAGRKHPSSMQARALKASMPLIALPHYLMTSQIFRTKVTCERFLLDLGDLMSHVKALDANETNIDSAVGPTGVSEFIDSVLGILEVVSQHPALLMDHHQIVIESILPSLASLLSSDNGDTRLFCLGLFAEGVSLYLNHDHLTEEEPLLNDRFLSETVVQNLLPQMEQILLDADPLPLFGSKLLLALLERNPSLVRNIQELDIVPVLFQALIDHRSMPTSSVVRHVVNILACLASSQDMDMRLLYDHGIIDQLMNLFCSVWPLCKDDENQSAITVLTALTELLHIILKYVAGIIRTILQATKSGQGMDTEVAESLLMSNKMLVELTDILIQMLCLSDSDLRTLSCGCLSLLAQLFGGEYGNALTSQNATGLTDALGVLDAKEQKILLKFIKRIISADESQAKRLHDEGSGLTAALRELIHTASSQADTRVSSLAAEILGSAGITT